MRVLPILLASACALAFAAPASAQFAATVGADYSHISLSNSGGDANIWNIDGSAVASIPDTGFNVQGNVGYNNINGGGASANGWNVGGAAFWADEMLRIGATVNYDSFDANGLGSVHFTNYGGFAEWFPGMFTLGIKGGGVSLSANAFGVGGSTTGSYIGGEAVAYAMPDLALSGTIDYASISGGHETDFTPQVEWLFSEDVPVSVYAGYTYSNLGASGAGSLNANTFFIGLRFYVNGNGSAALIDRQRTGVVNWGTAFNPLARTL